MQAWDGFGEDAGIKGRGNSMADNEGIFRDAQHKKFYSHYLNKCGCSDPHHKALVYCLGVDGNTRGHIHDIYDFGTGCINTGCLHGGWQTDSSRKVTRLAFALYTDRAVSVYDYGSQSDRLGECRCYSVSEIMCCEYVRYFLEEVKIRYSDYL